MAAEQKIRITVDLDPELHHALKVTAAQKGLTISEIVRRGLASFVRQVAAGAEPQPRPRPFPTPRSARVQPAYEPGTFGAVVAEIAAEVKGEQYPNPFDAALGSPDPDAGA